jgi:hypothetical protein
VIPALNDTRWSCARDYTRLKDCHDSHVYPRYAGEHEAGAGLPLAGAFWAAWYTAFPAGGAHIRRHLPRSRPTGLVSVYREGRNRSVSKSQSLVKPSYGLTDREIAIMT